MKDLKMLLRMVTIVMLAAVHAAESCNVMSMGEIKTKWKHEKGLE